MVLIFVAIYYFLFKYLILKFDIPLPGRKKGEEEVKLFSKQDYKDKKEIQLAIIHYSEYEEKALYYLEGLGGKENIKDVTNCTTRLRLTVKDESKVQESAYFTHNQMSHGLVKVAKCSSRRWNVCTSGKRSI